MVNLIVAVGSQWASSKHDKFFKRAQNDIAGVRVNASSQARCKHLEIKFDILAKRCVICHLNAWTLLIIVAWIKIHLCVELDANITYTMQASK